MTSLLSEARRRILVLDGAMATMIQGLGYGNVGCCDLLNLTEPHRVAEIHRQYVEAGADIIKTNTFNSNAVSLADYGMRNSVEEINRTAVALARKEAGDKAWVAGCIGPTSDSCRDFRVLKEVYAEQSRALIEGGVDLLLIESVYDLLFARAAICGVQQTFRTLEVELPIMISATLNSSGRLISGDSLEEFVDAASPASPLSIGLNCGYGASDMLAHLHRLAAIAPCLVSAHPNAGLPDENGNYPYSPEMMAAVIRRMVDLGVANIVGGCCGTTPAHIAAIADAVKKTASRFP